MSVRAKERLYLTAASALVRENDPDGRTLFCNVGNEISDADVVTYQTELDALGWTTEKAMADERVYISSVHIKHDDASEAGQIVLPARSVIQDVMVVCTEDAAGSPDIDFGELDGDTDGILDGLGTEGICDTTDSTIDASAEFIGRGALITSQKNEDGTRVKVRKYYENGATLTNKKNSAGTAGEWTIHVMYIILPEVS